MKIWDKGGITNYHFSPIYTFPGKGNANDYAYCALHDKKGDAYYVSYGPFAALLPYFLFKVFFIPVGLSGLIGFNLIVHFLVSLFLYLLVLRIVNKRIDDFSLPALSVFILYVFSPGTLWFHGNIYFSEILAQLFLAAGIYVFYVMLEQRAQKASTVTWYGVMCFFGIYNEWLGLFFTVVTGGYLLVKSIKDRGFLKPFLVAVLAGVLSLTLLILQYSSIAGFDELLKVETMKLAERNGGALVSGYEASASYSFGSSQSYKLIEGYLNNNFLNVINTLAFLVPAFILLCLYRKKYFFTKKQCIVIGNVVMVVALHHFAFINFTASHDFSVLKTGYFLILLTGIIIHRLELLTENNKNLRLGYVALVLLFFAVKSYESIQHYNHVNNLNNVHEVYKLAGNDIKKLARPDKEIVFTNTVVSPNLIVYAECNARFTLNRQDVRDMARIKQMTASYFFVRNNRVVSITRYAPDGDSVRVEIQPVNQ
ncbi:MAG TPA: hypothetical protein VK177_20490 [Flavobacteriales bacterium]|nr:hypothetical protein [Flavobacteriales bacterium]